MFDLRRARFAGATGLRGETQGAGIKPLAQSRLHLARQSHDRFIVNHGRIIFKRHLLARGVYLNIHNARLIGDGIVHHFKTIFFIIGYRTHTIVPSPPIITLTGI